MSRKHVVVLGVVALSAASLLSGCTTMDDYRQATPGELRMSAAWTEDGQHMNVQLRNVGGTSLALGNMNMSMTGPDGTPLSVHWNGMAPQLDPGKSMSFELHSMRMQDGTMGMTMDHAMAGDHMQMEPGDYTIRMGTASAHAVLGN